MWIINFTTSQVAIGPFPTEQAALDHAQANYRTDETWRIVEVLAP